MRKNTKIVVSVLTAVIVVAVAVLVFARCSNGDKVEVVNIADTNKTGKPSDTNPGDNPKNTTKDSAKSTTPDTKSTDSNPDKTVNSGNNSSTGATHPDDIPESTIAPVETSLLMTAMKLLPVSSFDEDPNAQVAILNYASMRSCFDRMKYESPRDIEKIITLSPPFMVSAFQQPLNDFDRPKNWIWSINSMIAQTYWVAGDFNLNMNITPMLKKDKYKQFTLVPSSMYTYFLAPEGQNTIRYTKFVAPIANSFAMFAREDSSDIARKTAINVSENGDGMLGNPEYKKLLSLIGEPEACALTRSSASSDGLFQGIAHPDTSNPNYKPMPEQDKEAFLAAKDRRRPRSLKYTAIAYYPGKKNLLRFFLFYETPESAKSDMPVFKNLWNDKKVAQADRIRQMLNITDTRFSVKENIGIVECTISVSAPGISVVNEISVGLAMGMVVPFMKQ